MGIEHIDILFSYFHWYEFSHQMMAITQVMKLRKEFKCKLCYMLSMLNYVRYPKHKEIDVQKRQETKKTAEIC